MSTRMKHDKTRPDQHGTSLVSRGGRVRVVEGESPNRAREYKNLGMPRDGWDQRMYINSGFVSSENI